MKQSSVVREKRHGFIFNLVDFFVYIILFCLYYNHIIGINNSNAFKTKDHQHLLYKL